MMWKFSDSINNRWAIVTLVIGLCLTVLIAQRVNLSNQVRINQAAKLASDQIVKMVHDRIELYQYGLRGTRGSVITAGESNLSRRLFLRYSLSRDTDKEFPGARGFGFIRLVKPSERDRFVYKAQQDGWLSFDIKEFSPNTGDRYVVQYIEPVVRNLQAVGLDIASEKSRRLAAQKSIDTGLVQLTGPITLVQALDSPHQSVLILMPIYDSVSVPDTLQKRRDRAYGWSYAPLLMEEVMADLALEDDKTHLDLYDVTDPNNRQRFFDSNVEFDHGIESKTYPSSKNSKYYQVNTFPIYGRIWESHFSISSAFIQNLGLQQPRNIIAIGVLISFLSAALLGVVRVNRMRRKEVIEQQAKMAAIVESSSDGIIGTTLVGVITSWNKGAEKIFGYQCKEVIGRSLYSLLIPDDRYDSEIEVLEQLKFGGEIKHFDTIRKTKAGKEVHVSVVVSPIYDASGSVIGISKSVRDISLQKATEATIHELNNSLEKQVKERTEDLQKLNLILNDVLNASSEIAIIATDIHGVITLFNSGAQQMLGYSGQEVIGKLTPLEFHVAEQVTALRCQIASTVTDPIKSNVSALFYHALHKEFDSREWTYVNKQGESLDVSVVITPMHDNKGVVIGFLNMAIDITEQKKSNVEIISMRDQLLMAANVAQLGIWTWNIETDELDWNDTMFQLYQQPISLKKQGVMYQHWVERVHLDDRDDFEKHLRESISNHGKFDRMYRIVLPDKSIRYIHARAYVEEDRQGRVVSITGINRDITQEHELEAWLRRAKEEADAASLAKSDFLANMSHEIRTPMNAVLGMLQLVQRTSLDTKQEDYIGKAHRAAKSLLGLINDILDYSKVDAGKLEIEHAPFEIGRVISELDALLSGVDQGNNVVLTYDIDPDIPTFLVGDHLRLLQVLTNLSSNALKFTLDGQVNIGITQTASSTDSVDLLFSVKDTGIGIDAHKKEAIFEVFSQAESSTARRFGGSGLGLVICRRLVRLMGGEIMIDSVLEEGSCFYFSLKLPIADQLALQANAERLIATKARRSPAKLQGLRLLVIDDNPLNRQVAEELLQAEGAIVTLAEGGEEGVITLMAAETAFDLVLMDMQMPEVDGLEATERIRKEARFAQLPIIAMTANVSKADQQACFQAGMDDHIGKPLDIDVMVQVICKHVERLGSTNMQKTLIKEHDQPLALSARVESSESIMARFAGNKDLYHSLTQSFLQESEAFINTIEQAINDDIRLVQETFHTLKGSTGTMGLRALSVQLGESEVKQIFAQIDPDFYRQQVKIDLDSMLKLLFLAS